MASASPNPIIRLPRHPIRQLAKLVWNAFGEHVTPVVVGGETGFTLREGQLFQLGGALPLRGVPTEITITVVAEPSVEGIDRRGRVVLHGVSAPAQKEVVIVLDSAGVYRGMDRRFAAAFVEDVESVLTHELTHLSEHTVTAAEYQRIHRSDPRFMSVYANTPVEVRAFLGQLWLELRRPKLKALLTVLAARRATGRASTTQAVDAILAESRAVAIVWPHLTDENRKPFLREIAISLEQASARLAKRVAVRGVT